MATMCSSSERQLLSFSSCCARESVASSFKSVTRPARTACAPMPEGGVAIKLSSQLAADYQVSAIRVVPVKERLPRRGAI